MGQTEPKPKALFLTDLDGTLTDVSGRLGPTDRAALAAAREWGVICAIATGRPLESLRRTVPTDFPVDYVIFSTGAGLCSWPERALLFVRNLSPREVTEGFATLTQLKVDFFVHRTIPDNQHFLAVRGSGVTNGDFERRFERHRGCCALWNGWESPRRASQFLVVDPTPNSHVLCDQVRAALPGYEVVRATSPLDGTSAWIEVFGKNVSKGVGAADLAARLGIPRERVGAIGNDFNDEAMLAWAPHSYVTDDGAPEMRTRGWRITGSGGRGAVATAIEHFLAAISDPTK